MSPKMSLKAVIYTRVSSEAQEDNSSLAAQFVACQHKAQEMGAEIVAHLEEVESGGLYLARPKIQKALELIESGAANTLIVMRLDRTGRDVDGLRDIRRRIQRAGGQLIFADGMQFESTPIANFLFTNLAGVAELERELIKKRLADGTMAALEKGRMCGSGLSPYGWYLSTKADETRGTYAEYGKYYRVPEQAAVVEEIYNLLDSGFSLRSVAVELQRREIAPPRNKVTAARYRKKELDYKPHWTPTTIRNIALNPIHKGKPARGKNAYLTDESRLSAGKTIYNQCRRPEEEWTYVEAMADEPIVSEAQWQRVKEKIKSNKMLSGNNEARYLLTGLIFCPLCGQRLAGGTSYTKYTKKNGDQQTYIARSYICLNRKPSNILLHTKCTLPNIAASKLEPLVIAALLHVVTNPREIKKAYPQFATRRKAQLRQEQAALPQNQYDRWRTELRDLELREIAAATAKVEAIVAGQSTGAFNKILDDLAERRQKIEDNLRQNPEVRASTLDVPKLLDYFAVIHEKLESILLSEAVPSSEKNRLLRLVIRRIDLTNLHSPNWPGVSLRLLPPENDKSKLDLCVQNETPEKAVEVEATPKITKKHLRPAIRANFRVWFEESQS